VREWIRTGTAEASRRGARARALSQNRDPPKKSDKAKEEHWGDASLYPEGPVKGRAGKAGLRVPERIKRRDGSGAPDTGFFTDYLSRGG